MQVAEQQEELLSRGIHEVRPIWTSLMEEMLIYYIRANRVLWDLKHPHFTKPMLKRRKVEDIAATMKKDLNLNEEFSLSPEDVWRKFRNLRTFFVREVRKVNESKQNPSNEPYQSHWIHFNRMMFLVGALKKSINARVPLPGVGTHPASVKLEGSKSRIPIGSLSDLNNIQQQQQELEDELRIGGEWDARNTTTIAPVLDAPVPGSSRDSDRPMSRCKPSAKRLRQSHTQEKKQKQLEVTETFTKFVSASIRRCPEEKQSSLMAHIAKSIAEFNDQ